MRQYFSRITSDHWTAKNKLEEAAHSLAHIYDRWLMNENEVQQFCNDLRDDMDMIHRQHSRCKPLKFSIERAADMSGDYWIYCDGVFNMSLFLVNYKPQ